MVILSVAAFAILTIVFTIKRRQLAVRGGKTLAYHFFDKSLEFLIPFTVVGSSFLLLSISVDGTSNETTIQRLILLEKLVGLFKWFASIVKASALATVGILIMLYLLSLTRIPSKYTSKFIPFFKSYQKVVKSAYMLAIIFFSFTFFGTQEGEPSAKLRFRINETEVKYGELRQEVEQAVSKEVAAKLLEKVKSALPEDYRDDLDEQDQFHAIFSELRTKYQAYKTDYERRDPGSETIINNPPPPDAPPGPRNGDAGSHNKVTPPAPAPRESSGSPQTGERIVFNIFEESRSSPAQIRPAPTQANIEKIAEAKTAVRDYRERVQTKFVKILKSDYGREIALELPKTLTDTVKDIVFKTVTDRYPILKPLIEVFFETLDKELETRAQKAIDRATSSLVVQKDVNANVIKEEASKVVADTEVRPSRLLMAKARQIGEVLRTRIQAIRDAIGRLNSEQARLDDLEKQMDLLTCNNEELRKEASAKLAAASPYLTQEQVKAIEALLDDNTSRLRKSSLRPNYYEEVPIGYYAALALRNMRSPHMSEGLREAAVDVIKRINGTPVEERVYYRADDVERQGLTDP